MEKGEQVASNTPGLHNAIWIAIKKTVSKSLRMGIQTKAQMGEVVSTTSQ